MTSTRLEEMDNISPALLRQALWPGNLCAAGRSCQLSCPKLCHGARGDQLGRYHQYYRALVTTYVDEAPSPPRLLSTREELFGAINQLKSRPDVTRDEFCQLVFPRDDDQVPHDPVHLAHAVSLIVKVMLMIEPSTLHYLSHRLEKGTLRAGWEANVSFSQYISDIFPMQDHHVLSHVDNERFLHFRSKLRATKLKELGISFRPTHDIQDHLSFDRAENVLEIFHHTAFLKEQLHVTKRGGDFSDPYVSIKVGALPRQLLLEVLDSIQSVLFPLADPHSKDHLRSLVRSNRFDPDALNFEFRSIRNPGEENPPFFFLSARLSDLYNEMQNPPARGWLGRIVERRSTPRYMMMATLIGVVFAVFLGMLSLAVSSYQAWIAYQAWKHPISPGPSGG